VPFASEFHAHHEEEDHDDHGEEELAIDLDQQRQAIRIDAGLRGFSRGPLESVRVSMNFVDYWHQELEVHEEEEEVGTRFDNDTIIGRLELNQRPMGRLSGQIGLWGQSRDFVAVGEEALAPPAGQTSLAAFAYEEVDLGRVKLQLGARIERNEYSPAEREEGEHHHDEEEGEDHHDEEELEVPEATPRDFTGVSGSMGLHVGLTNTTALVGNFTRSYRAPALEELYNFGPHVGNLAFEVGNPDLSAEKTRGMDLSVRHQSQSFYGQVNFFYYDIEGFVFPDFTDEFLDGLRVAKFVQGDSRFVGLDASGSLRLRGNVRLNAGLGLVDAELTESNTPLPRIPPRHARLGLDLPVQRLTLRPELVWAARQDKIFSNETATDGYAVVNFTASYTAIAGAGDAIHVFTLKAYNLGNTVYRNHTSFIKNLAPEMGRGVLLTWALRLF
jgi:iron complex outermembrane receptor protein